MATATGPIEKLRRCLRRMRGTDAQWRPRSARPVGPSDDRWDDPELVAHYRALIARLDGEQAPVLLTRREALGRLGLSDG